MQPERTSHPKRVAAIFIRDLEGEIMVKLIKADFDGQVMQFNNAGWFNATAAANQFGKEPHDWLTQIDTITYINALSKAIDGKSLPVREINEINNLPSSSSRRRSKTLSLAKSSGYVKTKSGQSDIGGGTWLHPKLAVSFARWCSVDFAIWCDEQIDAIIHGERESIDWGMMRHASKSSNKVANEILMMVRQEQGKETKHFHYANEAKLVNFALTGKFEPVDRNSLSAQDLDLLASLENRNSVLIGRDVDRETRKEILCQMVSAARLKLLK